MLLEDGTRFDGEAVRARPGPAVGEVVFTTGMSGYQESMTDPSFAGQLITFTYPHIGNYGASAEAMESDRVHARGGDHARGGQPRGRAGRRARLARLAGRLRRSRRSPASTRARWSATSATRGAMRGGVFPATLDEARRRELIEAEPPMAGRDLAREVTPAEAIVLGPGAPRPARSSPSTPASRTRSCATSSSAARALELHPCTAPGRGAAGRATPTRSSWPTAPATRRRSATSSTTVRELVGKQPVFGICLGHQLLCRAVGLETFKLPFGHRGANHPVKDLRDRPHRDHRARTTASRSSAPTASGRIDADEPVRWETDFGAAALTHVNLYDRTVEGLDAARRARRHGAVPPRGRPRPARRLYLFDRFLDQIRPIECEARLSRCRVGATTSTRS